MVKATLLVGGAAIIGAIGITGIASLQGLQKIHDMDAKHKKENCCEDLEKIIQMLQEDFEDEQKDQDRLEARQRGLCNLVSISIYFNNTSTGICYK